VDAKYVYGVSATPKRSDSMDKNIYMMLGPLRHTYSAIERAREQGIGHYFIPRYTRLVDTEESKNDINKAYSIVASSEVRNNMIIEDVKACVQSGQTPVILTRFKEQASQYGQGS
jgi:superfamily II DNA or RNA helicase